MRRSTAGSGISTVTDGIIRLTRADVNCYLLVDDDRITLVDAGLPRFWPLLVRALHSLDATLDDVHGVVLTHGHFDHVGMCERLVDEAHLAVHVHEKDVGLARHPYRYAHEAPRTPYPFRHPKAVPTIVRMVAAGALVVKGVSAHGDLLPGATAPGTNGLVPVFSPGHTFGHCGFHHPRTGTLFSGDALVTLDPYTGARGPRIVAGAATADSPMALSSLEALRATRARLVLPGHGDPFERGIGRAVDAALAAGPE